MSKLSVVGQKYEVLSEQGGYDIGDVVVAIEEDDMPYCIGVDDYIEGYDYDDYEDDDLIEAIWMKSLKEVGESKSIVNNPFKVGDIISIKDEFADEYAITNKDGVYEVTKVLDESLIEIAIVKHKMCSHHKNTFTVASHEFEKYVIQKKNKVVMIGDKVELVRSRIRSRSSSKPTFAEVLQIDSADSILVGGTDLDFGHSGLRYANEYASKFIKEKGFDVGNNCYWISSCGYELIDEVAETPKAEKKELEVGDYITIVKNTEDFCPHGSKLGMTAEIVGKYITPRDYFSGYTVANKNFTNGHNGNGISDCDIELVKSKGYENKLWNVREEYAREATADEIEAFKKEHNTPKFKVGDLVEVLDGSGIPSYNGGWARDMRLFVGKKMCVREVKAKSTFSNSFGYRLAGSTYTWDERGLKLAKEVLEVEPKSILTTKDIVSDEIKVGDIVTGKPNNHYGITTSEATMRVVSISGISMRVVVLDTTDESKKHGIGTEYGVLMDRFVKVKDYNSKETISIEYDGKKTTKATYTVDGEVKKTVTCRRNPEDAHDIAIATDLCVERLFGKKETPKKVEEKVGKVCYEIYMSNGENMGVIGEETDLKDIFGNTLHVGDCVYILRNEASEVSCKEVRPIVKDNHGTVPCVMGFCDSTRNANEKGIKLIKDSSYKGIELVDNENVIIGGKQFTMKKVLK